MSPFLLGVALGAMGLMTLDWLGALLVRKRVRIWLEELERTEALVSEMRGLEMSLVDYLHGVVDKARKARK